MRQPSDGGCVCCENESSAFVSARPATAKPVDCKKSRRFTNYPQEVWRLVQDAAQERTLGKNDAASSGEDSSKNSNHPIHCKNSAQSICEGDRSCPAAQFDAA